MALAVSQIPRPGPVTFISSLLNGTVVAGFVHSGIQLLDLYDGCASSPQLALVHDVRTLDQGRIIAIIPTTRDHVQVRETATMSQLLTAPPRRVHGDVVLSPSVLSASLENRTIFYSCEERGGTCLALYRFGEDLSKWTVKMDQSPWVCAISPTGTRLVTFHNVRYGDINLVCVWDPRNGQLQASLLLVGESYCFPSCITFHSETRFYSHHGDYCVPYHLGSSSRAGTTPLIVRREREL